MSKNVPEHQIIHLKLPTMHELLVTASERLSVPCILNNCFPSSLINEINIITSELVLRGFVVCLDMAGAHGDFWGEDNPSPVYQEERCIPRGSTG
jgi:hypothetical protein